MRQLIEKVSIIIFSLFILSGGCDEKKNTETPNEKPDQPMTEKFEFSNYDKSWKQVDSLENKGLPKSALELVLSIMEKASNENNQAMIIKALVYQMKFESYLEENDFSKGIARIDSLSNTNKEPLRQILASMKGELLLSYYKNNIYLFRDRSTTQAFELGDISTWDLKTLADVAYKSFDASLENAAFTQNIDLKDYAYTLKDTSKSAYETAPTLFDFLSTRAMDFYRNDAIAITRPINKFHLNDEAFFGDNATFLSISTESEDTLSSNLKYVQTAQLLAKFHESNQYPIARLRNELSRLRFANSKSNLPNKSELYRKALQDLKSKNANHPIISEVNAAIASLYVDLGNKANSDHKDYKLINEAHQLCLETIQLYKGTYGANLAQNILNQIETRSLSGNALSYYSINTPSLVKINYKNLDSIYLLVYETSDSEEAKYYYELKERVRDMKEISKKLIVLPKTTDFREHSTELALQELPIGNYAVVFSTHPTKLDVDNELHWVSDFQITDLAYSVRRISGENTGIQVYNRNTGNAIAKAKINVYSQEYNYKTRRNDKKLVHSTTSDANGWANIPHDVKAYSRSIELSYGKDNLSSNVYLYKETLVVTPTISDNLFTDRAIYRPGQTVYFKGIRLSTLNKTSKLEVGKKLTAIFKDANYQNVANLDLTTNEYGSFTGSFRIPTSGLSGQMSIVTDRGSVYFSVEEYKRPTFKVDFEKSSDELKLGETINLKGNATTYAGNKVDQATVKYVVKRTISYPYWHSWYFRIAPINTEATIIKEGVTNTASDGSFDIQFPAIADQSSQSKDLNYNFSIEVDVTDQNGETRSSTKHISISSSAIHLSIYIPSTIDVNEANQLTVETTNAEGQSVHSKGKIVISSLKKGPAFLQARPWLEPTKPLLSESEFKNLFPTMHYKTENKFERAIEATVAKIDFNTAEQKSIALNTKNWKVGEYRIETSSKDKFGEEVKDIQIITVTNSQSNQVPFDAAVSAYTLKNNFEPGETATVIIFSSLSNQMVLVESFLDGKLLEKKHIFLNKEQKTLQFKVEEKHRGGFSVQVSTVKYSQPISQIFQFHVPYSNKELQVSFETFRSKLLPGEQEEWRLRITGPKKEKIAAEMLLTMYDASLDAFRANYYSFSPFQGNRSASNRSFNGFGHAYGRTYGHPIGRWVTTGSIKAPTLNWFNYSFQNHYSEVREYLMNAPANAKRTKSLDKMAETTGEALSDSEMITLEESSQDQMVETLIETEEKEVATFRTNFNETAFFMPQLKTDANGDVLVTFTAPESLTTWKILGLAHSKELEFALIQNELITQKELMVQTNAPRFIRHGDELVLTTKISNITANEMTGTASVQLIDALTMQDLGAELLGTSQQTSFTVNGEQSTVVSWKIKAPETNGSLIIRVSAKAQNHTDGEELIVPVLTDKVLVTESFPMTNNGKGTRNFNFTKLVNSKESETLKHHAVTLEYSSNPAWYVIQALPYMMEYPYNCSEQIFTRFYANSIASNIVRSSPKIKAVFDQWKNSSPDAFLSNLEKNQQLKSLIIEETPWVLQAKDEGERKKRVALLFDFNKMDDELAKNLKQLTEAQVSNGGFPWFPGMPENRYVTQYIVSGLGHLNQLNIVSVKENKEVNRMAEKAVKYMDDRMLADYRELKKRNLLNKETYVSQTIVQYLYARSFFKSINFSKNEEEAFNYFKTLAEKNWLKLNLNNQAMMALAAHRLDNSSIANEIMKSILERSITTEEMGMYWKENERGYFWHQAPIETQSLLIEALHTIKKDVKAVNNAKIWLLRNKQTSDWKTTTATANASYALLIGGNSFADQSEQVTIEINGKVLNPEDFGSQVEAGTGYFQTTWTGKEISADLGKVKVTRETEGFSWGAMYWQYFEAMDKVTSAETNLKMQKQLFVVRQTSSGEVIVPVQDGEKLKRGEKIRVRIELTSDRNMEFVHLKDFRAAGFEPINVLSSYKWKNGLGFYENTRDVATHFFFDFLPKGNHVFEYDLRVNHSGNFSNGFATIQCMYAPEFSSHSNGVRVIVE